MEAEVDEMHVQIEKTRLNLWHLGGIILAMVMNAATAGGVWVSLTRDVSETQKQVSDLSNSLLQYQADLNATKTLIPPIQFRQGQISDQVAENKADIKVANERTDRLVEAIGSKLDSIKTVISDMGAQVKVLGSKIEDMGGKSDHTIFPRLPIASK